MLAAQDLHKLSVNLGWKDRMLLTLGTQAVQIQLVHLPEGRGLR